MPECSPSRTRRAIDIVEREMEIILAEKKAFERFHSRLSNIEPCPSVAATSAGRTAGGPAATVNAKQPVASQLRSVRTAYRETVMDLPHFEREYGETLAENLATEFSAAVASQVTDGTQLTPVLRRTLARGAKDARDERKTFRRSLARERDSLAEIHSALDDCERRGTEIERRIGEASASSELAALDDRLASLEETCVALVEERQAFIHDRPGVHFSGITGMSLSNYLYGDCEVTCPGLADLADGLERLRNLRQRCLR